MSLLDDNIAFIDLATTITLKPELRLKGELQHAAIDSRGTCGNQDSLTSVSTSCFSANHLSIGHGRCCPTKLSRRKGKLDPTTNIYQRHVRIAVVRAIPSAMSFHGLGSTVGSRTPPDMTWAFVRCDSPRMRSWLCFRLLNDWRGYRRVCSKVSPRMN
jgi:hypothetical protein